jgi:hypothetical protein
MIPIQSSKLNVCDFLEKMKSILESVDFDIRRDFIFQRYRVIDDPDDEYTNENTLLALDYDMQDVVEVLKALTLEDYHESMVDNVADGFNVFFVFGKRIRKRDVYIKVRLKQRAGMANSYVFCISFHFARQTINLYPYRKKKA